MTREILFRGKREDNGEWIIGHLLWYEDGKSRICATGTDIFCYEKDDSIIQTVAHRVIPETVGQYMGMTDNNDKRVFEGDIIQLEDNDCSIVKHGQFSEAWIAGDLYGWYYEDINSGKQFSFEGSEYSLKVVGNIHDNPEMIVRSKE